MNFLLRSSNHAAVEKSPVHDSSTETAKTSKSGSSLESLIAEDPFPQNSPETNERGSDKDEEDGYDIDGLSSTSDVPIIGNHLDVSEEEGWITIPSKVLPDDWNDIADVQSLRTLDRSFVFPGEQIHILACLSAYEQDTEIITPFKVAEVMSKKSQGSTPMKQNGNIECRPSAASTTEELEAGSQDSCKNGSKLSGSKLSAGETLLRKESHRKQTETLLQKFKNSHYFVRISDSSDQLWSKKGSLHVSSESSEIDGRKSSADGANKTPNAVSCTSAVIDTGDFDANASGGICRDYVQCCSLPSGDVVVLLQVNVGVHSLRDPIIEILQFEKYPDENLSSHGEANGVYSDQDPCRELLKWLLPLDNTLSLPSSPLPPSVPSSNQGTSNATQKANSSTSSGSQLFSFSNFRSYSMSSLPQNNAQPPPPQPPKAVSSKPNFEIDSWEQLASQKMSKSRKSKKDRILSFRGVSLERERFSVCCGLEGIYLPGRRWRRKLEIIQPVEIHSFAAACDTDDLLCVQIKNVSPEHASDVVIYVDAINIIFEEASKVGPPSSLPIACIEAGVDHSLPNLELRRGEEHSFILKPKPPTSMSKNMKINGKRSLQSSPLQAGNTAAKFRAEGKRNCATDDQYAILVTCRCNYTESKLFFKQPTSWRPRNARDLMVSVASEISGLSPDLNGKVSQLPVQVLTLQATNLTSEDLTLTVLAPASFTAPPSVVSLNSSPSTPASSFVGFSEIQERVNTENRGTWPLPVLSEHQKRNGDGDGFVSERASGVSDVISNNTMSCTHLWLQSRVPLGCVPSQSTATIKLELLPLTDGIITLDTLQIHVKEKGLTYIPEHSLKIYATSSISSGIM